MGIKRNLDLKSGTIPSLGFGTWQLKGSTAQESVEYALEVGYRHIDTADYYDNHREIAKAIRQSNVERKDIFLTTKVWRSDLAKQDVIDNTNRFLEELDTNYIDMLLIHWPNSSIPLKDTLDAFQYLKEKNKIKHIGVSNFTISKLKEGIKTDVEIENNQVELHPMLNQKELREYCDSKNILLTAYSPLVQGEILEENLIRKLANSYKRDPSQIVLNWIISRGIAAIPRSSNKEHIKSNFKSLDFELSNEDIDQISLIGTESKRLLNPPFAEWNQ